MCPARATIGFSTSIVLWRTERPGWVWMSAVTTRPCCSQMSHSLLNAGPVEVDVAR